MQTRRILLLFALVLGLTALVGSLAPAPSEDEGDDEPAPVEAAPVPGEAPDARSVTFAAGKRARTVRVGLGARLSVSVRASEPADAELAGLGLRRTAEPRVPARFDLIARPAGRYTVRLHPFTAESRVVGSLVFAERRSVRPRRRRG